MDGEEKDVSNGWLAQPERSTRLAIRFMRWTALNLGRGTARCFLYPITLYYLIASPVQRRASFNYLRRILKTKPTLVQVAKHIHCFSATILDRVYFLTDQVDDLDIRFPNKNIPMRLSERGQGCLLLGSHLGSFEVLRSYGQKKFPVSVKVLMHEGHNSKLVNVLNALNPSLKNMVVPLGREDSLLQIKDWTSAGHAVGMLGDRVVKEEKTTRCVLLGDPVEFATAPIVIAAALKLPVIVFFGLYLGGNRYEVRFELLAERIDLDRSTRQQDINHLTQRYVSIMERHMKLAPYNWFNFYDYWHDEEPV